MTEMPTFEQQARTAHTAAIAAFGPVARTLNTALADAARALRPTIDAWRRDTEGTTP